MTRTCLGWIVLAVLLAPVSIAAATEYQDAKVAVPVGDPGPGRVAFAFLRCNTCHQVEGEEVMAPPIADMPGPAIGAKQAAYDVGKLITAVVAPSHDIEPGGASEGGMSRMGDFTDVMTVRQMLDIVAYIQSLEE